jgi:O-antigen ligase
MTSFLHFSRLALLGLIYTTPFLAYYVSSSLFFPYITGKNFAFRTIVELMMFFWIPLAVLSSSWRPKIKSIIVSFYAFALILFSAALFGVNPMNSLFSNFERMEGFVTIFYLLFFTIITAVTLKEKEWNTFFYVSLAANALVVFDATVSAFKFPAQRLDGTLGNAGYLSIYAVWGMFLIAFLWVRHQYKNIAATSFLSLLFILNFFVLWKTQTRGTLLGLAVGVAGILLFYTYEFLKKKLGTMKASVFLSLAVLSFCVIAFFGLPLVKNSDFVKASPTLTRLASISLGEQTVRSRFMIWGMSYEGIKERPLLGFGQDNFGYVFAKHYNPEMFDQEQWFDRSHNVFFDWSIAGGLLGLLSYLSLFGAVLYAIVKAPLSLFTKNQKVILLGFLTIYFIHNIFIFDNLISYLSFFSLFAFVLYKTKHQKDNLIPEKNSPLVFWSSLFVSAIIFCVSFYHIVYKPLEKNLLISTMLGGRASNLVETTQSVLKDNTLYGSAEGREQSFYVGARNQ